MAKEKKDNPIIGIISLIFIGYLVYSCVGGSSETPEEKAERSRQEAEDKRKGFHCLSAWDGSHSEFKESVKSKMRDPDSFEHIETKVTPADQNGEHTVIMNYRAKNGFGGMNVGTAMGKYKNSDCSFSIISLE